MPQLADVPWPPDPIRTERLLLRPTKATDRPGYIELFCTDEPRRYLGGALDRDEVEAAMPATPGHRPGVFAVESAGEFIGVVTLEASIRLAARLGFREVERFVEYEAEQWFGVRD